MRSTSVSDSSSHPVKRLARSNVLYLGALCLAAANMAHADGPGITPAGSPDNPPNNPTKAAEPLPVPAAPAVTAPALPQGQPLISVNFKNTLVSEIVSMIADQGGVQIIISGDIKAKLAYIKLEDVTPEQAIEQVARASGLAWQKLQDNTFIIAEKDKLPEPPRGEGPAPNIYQPLLPPAVPGSGRAAIVAQPDLSRLPELIRNHDVAVEEEQDAPRNYQYVKVKNVGVRWMAWWIDPRRNPKPLEVMLSEDNIKRAFDPYSAKPIMDPNVMQAMTGSGYYNPPAFNSPYVPSGSVGREYQNEDTAGGYGQFVQPYTQGNAQFGFGGQGGGGGRGNRNNNRGNRGNRNNRDGGFGSQGGSGGGQGGGQGDGLFELPEGVDSIVAVDPQNALLVYGTTAGVQQLQTIIDYLDRPLRQVEIEANFIDVSLSDTRAFGIDFSSSNGPFSLNTSGLAPQNGTVSLGFVRNNFAATLRALISQNRAKIVTAPRVTAINNLTALISSSVQTPVQITGTTTGIGGQVGQNTNYIYVPAVTQLFVTPTINNDDTITVRMRPQVQQQGIPAGANQPPPISTQQIDTTAIVRDGDTIALGGFRTKNISTGGQRIPVLSYIPFVGRLFRTHNNNDLERELIIFLTARIIRRADEDTPVPNT